MSNKGFLWFCQNNDNTDYVELSIALAESIKKHNKVNKVCVITDSKTKITSPHIDVVKVLDHDDSQGHELKWANEWQAFNLTPFTHTIKLAADMLWTSNTDWWWYYLWRHDMVFAVDCYNYRDILVKDVKYRPHHKRNLLPNVYSDLTYFRKSQRAFFFSKVCKVITQNWQEVCESILVNCFDKYPSTDVVYALANRIIDPTQSHSIDYPWFKILHNKKSINALEHVADQSNYLMPTRIANNTYLGNHAITRPLHYVDKKTLKDMDVRNF